VIAPEDHPAKLADRPLTTCWRVRRQTLFLYEVDADELARHVPANLTVQEIRPGVGLFTVETLQYPPGHFGETTDTFELVLAIVVAPDLRLAMPIPRFSLFVTSVISSSAAFVETERVLLRTAMEHAPNLRMEYLDGGASVMVHDGDRPIVWCINSAGTPASYTPRTQWGLIYTNKDNAIHQGAFRWVGEESEHQKTGSKVSFHAHPVFRGLDLTRIRGCYRQMAAAPDLPTKIGYYHLGPLETR
jgi:hypothetical protein